MSELSEQEVVHVVIAILTNEQEVLVSRRKSDAHLGGLLEFPGGKVEQNESPMSALKREIKEEVNIEITHASPLIQFPFSYSDRNIFLDVYVVDKYSGNVCSQEGQEIYWKNIEALNCKEFPAANYGVIRALQLPKKYPVTPNYSDDPENFLINFESVVCNESIKIIQLRAHDLAKSDYLKLFRQCADLCRKHSAKLVLNRDVSVFDESLAAGIHLTSNKLLNTKKRPLDEQYLVGASCHNKNEVEYANKLNLDYVFLGPVKEKNHSHNEARLDWDGFSKLSTNSKIPVYAIGGLNRNDVDTSIQYGGQGIAAIREFWR